MRNRRRHSNSGSSARRTVLTMIILAVGILAAGKIYDSYGALQDTAWESLDFTDTASFEITGRVVSGSCASCTQDQACIDGNCVNLPKCTDTPGQFCASAAGPTPSNGERTRPGDGICPQGQWCFRCRGRNVLVNGQCVPGPNCQRSCSYQNIGEPRSCVSNSESNVCTYDNCYIIFRDCDSCDDGFCQYWATCGVANTFRRPHTFCSSAQPTHAYQVNENGCPGQIRGTSTTNCYRCDYGWRTNDAKNGCEPVP